MDKAINLNHQAKATKFNRHVVTKKPRAIL